MRIANTFKRMVIVVMMIMKQVDIAALTDDLIQLAEVRRSNLFLAKEKSDVEIISKNSIIHKISFRVSLNFIRY